MKTNNTCPHCKNKITQTKNIELEISDLRNELDELKTIIARLEDKVAFLNSHAKLSF